MESGQYFGSDRLSGNFAVVCCCFQKPSYLTQNCQQCAKNDGFAYRTKAMRLADITHDQTKAPGQLEMPNVLYKAIVTPHFYRTRIENGGVTAAGMFMHAPIDMGVYIREGKMEFVLLPTDF